MTRRIARSILIAVWVTLIVGGAAGYVVTRSVLLADLDQRIVERAHGTILERAGHEHSLDAAFRDDRFMIVNQSGRTLERMGTQVQPALQSQVIERRFATLSDEGRLRSLAIRVQMEDVGTRSGESQFTIIYSSSARGFDHAMEQLVIAFLLIGLAIGVASIVAVWWVTRRVMRPMNQAVHVISRVDEYHFDKRVEESSLVVEFQPIARTVNELLDRLEASFTRRKQFLADASHELRTPVAALLTTLEVALRRTTDLVQMRYALEMCLHDASSLRRLVNDLFEHVRSDSPDHCEAMLEIDLASILSTCVRDAENQIGSKQIEIKLLNQVKVPIRSVPRRLHSIVSNLLLNAVEYHQGQGEIKLSAATEADTLVLEIADDGPGIPASALPRIFDPFFRAAQTHDDAHLGMGLFLVHLHVQVLEGTCNVVSQEGEGTSFTIRLPIAAHIDKEECGRNSENTLITV